MLDSLVETTISRDILSLTRVDKPALFRQFRLSCDYSGQIISYQKMLGQLQDAGNTTTLAHYLRLQWAAGLVTGLEKFSGARVRQRGSSPKLLVLNTALMTASSGMAMDEARNDRALWGRLVESAAGAHLINTCSWERTASRSKSSCCNPRSAGYALSWMIHDPLSEADVAGRPRGSGVVDADSRGALQRVGQAVGHVPGLGGIA